MYRDQIPDHLQGQDLNLVSLKGKDQDQVQNLDQGALQEQEKLISMIKMLKEREKEQIPETAETQIQRKLIQVVLVAQEEA